MENMNTAIGCKRLREFDINSNTLLANNFALLISFPCGTIAPDFI